MLGGLEFNTVWSVVRLSNFGISQGASIQHEVFFYIYIQKLELHYVALSNFLNLLHRYYPEFVWEIVF